MKNLIILLILLLSLTSSYGQQYISTVPVFQTQSAYKVGSIYYPSGYQGLSLLMSDIEFENSDLYFQLLPTYKEIERKRNRAIVSFVAGGVAGTAFTLAGFADMASLVNQDPIYNPEFPTNTQFIGLLERNRGLIGIGFGCYIVGGIVGYILSPKQNDFYRFINLHNRNSKSEKMEMVIGLDMSYDSGLGLRFNMKF
jgi:hypothetical protein